MDDMEEILRIIGADKEGWTTDGLGVLICPCGHRVEPDGECPEGHVSPLIVHGLI